MVAGIKVLTATFDGDLKAQADRRRDKLGSGLVVLGRDGEHQSTRTALIGSTVEGVLRKTTKPTVVVYHLHGQIMDGHKPSAGSLIDGPTVKALDELRADPQVKGVVLRINSPGGSATASENIRVAIERLVAAKPVVFSMGEVAASGGYLVACAKAPIFADADTITGSIGVFGMSLSFDTLLRRVGVNLETVAIDEAARQFEIGNPWTDEELNLLKSKR